LQYRGQIETSRRLEVTSVGL